MALALFAASSGIADWCAIGALIEPTAEAARRSVGGRLLTRSKHPCAPMGCPHCSEWRERSGPRRRAARPTALGVARLLPLPQAPRRRIGSSLQPAKVRALGTAGPTAHAGYLVAVTGEGRKAG